MNPPLLHERTKAQLDLYLKNPAHALMLDGEPGIGKYFVAQYLADEQNLSVNTVAVLEGQSSITIDQIRELYSVTKTSRKQVIVIKDAHYLGLEAQNAFLKLLEEPPENTRFILTVNRPDNLLATIQSRVQTITVHKPTEQQLMDYFAKDDDSFIQLTKIAGNLPGVIAFAIQDEADVNSITNSMNIAKQFYAGNSYVRHQLLMQNSFEKEWSYRLTTNLGRIIESLIFIKSTDEKTLKRLINQANLLQQTESAIGTLPGNPKIHLTKLAEML